MRCPKCGEELEAGIVYCKKCGQELQIVPDYDPLDELVIGQEEEKPKNEPQKEEEPEEETEELKPQRSKVLRQVVLLLILILAGFGVFMASYYSISKENNYSYQLKKGMSLAKKEQYEEALPYLKRAQELQSGHEGADTQPLRYLARAYAAAGAKELAVDCMKDAIDMEEAAREDNYDLPDLYLELMDILNETGQTSQIETFIEDCKYEKIKELLLPYRVEKPVCDTPEGTYGYYLSLELEAKYGSIYYTLDGTEPTAESTRYEKPIELMEGETLLSAVAINKKGMVSEKLVLVYKLEFKENTVDDNEEV